MDRSDQEVHFTVATVYQKNKKNKNKTKQNKKAVSEVSEHGLLTFKTNQ